MLDQSGEAKLKNKNKQIKRQNPSKSGVAHSSKKDVLCAGTM
jgi:hypothetical protein